MAPFPTRPPATPPIGVGTHAQRGDPSSGDPHTGRRDEHVRGRAGRRRPTDDWPSEFFLEGPAPGGEELLRRTVDTVRRQSARSARTRGWVLSATVVIACALLTGAGMAAGHWMTSVPVLVAEHPVVATDTLAGARMTATVWPADGGSLLDVTVTGLPVGTPCQLTVIGRNGVRVSGGSWRIGPTHPTISSSAWFPPDQVAAIDVTTGEGDLYATVG
jgi:hypothetical protein